MQQDRGESPIETLVSAISLLFMCLLASLFPMHEEVKYKIIVNGITKLLGLGVDMVKPWNSVRINLVLGLRGTDIRLGLDNRHLIIEGHRGL